MTLELGSLHPITQGADASWNSEDRSIQLENRLYKKINVDKDYEDWENQFEAKNPDLVQIKKEIILNNFEERISIHKPIYTFKWTEGKRYAMRKVHSVINNLVTTKRKVTKKTIKKKIKMIPTNVNMFLRNCRGKLPPLVPHVRCQTIFCTEKFIQNKFDSRIGYYYLQSNDSIV